MFASLNLPFLLTAIILSASVVLVGIVSRRRSAFAWALLASVIGFIPSCTGIMYVVDQFRYGRFDYAIATDAPQDGYLEFPPSARNLTVYRSAPGHKAKFDITTLELKEWIEAMRAKCPELNRLDEGESWATAAPVNEIPKRHLESLENEIARGREELFNNYFSNTGWVFNSKTKEFHVMRSARGGGYMIWHEPGTNSAIMSASYW